jgi:hypothetical protein
MPHIPIPPAPTMTTQQIIQKLQTINTMPTQNNVVQQIRDVAAEQARLTMIELMKQQTELKRKTFLTIENIDKIRGSKYSESLYVGGVKEWDNHYEFTLLGYSSNQIETILLHRRQTDDKRYIMEYKGHTIWLSKDDLSSIDKIIECMTKV